MMMDTRLNHVNQISITDNAISSSATGYFRDQDFILTDMPANKRSSYVSSLLRAKALLLFYSTYENWDVTTPLSWRTLRTSMKEYFAPPKEDRHRQDE
jgi:hypothetical protein